MKTAKRIGNAWMIAAVVLGFTVTTNSAYADTILISPGTGASDDIKNGGFESGTGTGTVRQFAAVDDWFNLGPNGQNINAVWTGWGRTGYGGTANTGGQGPVQPAVDTGYTIAAGDTFSLSFWHGTDGNNWGNETDTIDVYLYSASGDIWSGSASPTIGSWNQFSANSIPAANIGETLFLRFVVAGVVNDGDWGTIDDVTLTVSPESASLALAITPATVPATGFDLEWQSQAGKLYNLRTSTDLANPIAGWDLVEGDIVATPPTNVENVDPADPRRFYAVEEFAAPPPPPLLEEDFESDNGGFTTSVTAGTAWEWGDPDSTGLGGTVSIGNGGSTNCRGTDIGNPGFYADPTTDSCLRSPDIDLSGVTGAELTFAEALDLEAADTAELKLINAVGDVEIATVYTADDSGSPSTADWAPANGGNPIDLSAGAGLTVYLQWCLSGTGGGTDDYMGWYIDDVVVTETTP